MKKTVLIFLIAWVLVAVSADVIAQTKPKRRQAGSVKMVVCKDGDEDCFIRAAETCHKANVTIIKSIDLFGILPTTTSYMEIKGGQKGNCIFYLRTEKVDVKLSGDLIRKMKERGNTPQQIEQKELEANESADLTEGQYGLCTFKTERLVTLLKKWKTGAFAYPDDWQGGNCRGTMFDQ